VRVIQFIGAVRARYGFAKFSKGCEGVFLGIESGNQTVLKNMNKSVTIEKYQKGLNLLKEYGIITYASFIIGFPGETSRTIQDTVRFIKEFQPTFYRTNLWYCDPKTPIWDKRNEFDLKGSQYEWSHGDMDSRTACDIIDEIFLSVEESIWLPLYNFDFQGIFHLLHRGHPIEKVKDFISAFNSGIKEKLRNTEPKNISSGVITALKGGL
jgi:anaerobic magnesium-protoporphyrin IX monomethyl ester cyclase